jgi:1,4-dihydroxy-2-naphthoyl-CoA hydrolase
MTGIDAALTEAARTSMPYAELLGLEVLSATADEVQARLPWEERLCTAGGILHGGALMSLADAAAAYCAFLNLPEAATGTATIESKTNFFRGVRDGHIVATSRPLHRGRTTIVVETDLHDAAGKHVARVTQTQAVLGG